MIFDGIIHVVTLFCFSNLSLRCHGIVFPGFHLVCLIFLSSFREGSHTLAGIPSGGLF